MSGKPSRPDAPAADPTETIGPPAPAGDSPEPPGAPLSGILPAAETVGRYSVLAHLGSGGMGSVYTAYDPRLDRKVALKLVRGDRNRPGEQHRLLQEARALAQLSHANVVRVYDVGWHEDRVFFAMELASGRNLWQWLKVRKRKWRRVFQLFAGVARGLAAAHRQGLVHRDLKPENILVGDDGEALIADFGLVKFRRAPEVGGSGDSRSPSSLPPADRPPGERQAGTPAYMAPELHEGGDGTELSDQFSFCVAFYVALFGELPSRAGASPPPGSWLSRRRAADGPGGHGVPAWLLRVVRRGMSPDPEHRYPSMELLLEDLLRRDRRRKRQWAAALVLLAAALGTWLWEVAGLRPADRCSGGEKHFAEVWRTDQTPALQRALEDAGAPLAAETARRTASLLDGYGEAWIESHRDACEATRLRGEQSERMLDLRMLCLERRREEVRALTGVLLSGGAEIGAGAVRAVESLSPLSACAAGAELALVTPPPEGDRGRGNLESLQARLAHQAVARLTGQNIDRQSLEELVAEIEEAGYPPLLAEARLELGLALFNPLEDIDSAVETLELALEASLRGGNRATTAIILGRLAELTGYNQGDPDRGLWWGRFARATLEALGPGHLEARIGGRSSLGLLAWSTGSPQEARSHWLEALRLGQELWGAESSRLTDLINNLALVSDSPAERLSYLERALEIEERVLGPSNPMLANTLVNLGALAGEAGEYSKGLSFARRAAQILESAYSPDHANLAYPLTLEGELHNRLDRPDEAAAALERAQVVSGTLGERHPLRIQLLFDLAETMLLQLDLPRAEAYHDRAAALADHFPPGSPFASLAPTLGGRIHLSRGRAGEARRALRRAADELAEAESPPPAWLAATLRRSLGEAELALGRSGAARENLEEAVRIAEAMGHEPLLLAACRFALGRSLSAEDPERARDLVRRAGAEIPAGGSPATRQLARRIEAWLGRPP